MKLTRKQQQLVRRYITAAKAVRKDHWNVSAHSCENWKPDRHNRVREELIRCLDKIVALERSFVNAQEEVARLRKYIKETAEEKELCEMTFKREAMELRQVVDDKSRETGILKESLNDELQELRTKEITIKRIEELEYLLEDRDLEITRMKSADDMDVTYLQNTLEATNMELEELKREMRAAINSFESLKTDKEHLIDMRESSDYIGNRSQKFTI